MKSGLQGCSCLIHRVVDPLPISFHLSPVHCSQSVVGDARLWSALNPNCWLPLSPSAFAHVLMQRVLMKMLQTIAMVIAMPSWCAMVILDLVLQFRRDEFVPWVLVLVK